MLTLGSSPPPCVHICPIVLNPKKAEVGKVHSEHGISRQKLDQTNVDSGGANSTKKNTNSPTATLFP